MGQNIVFIALMVGLIGCADLKQKFGTGAETPELRIARAECRALAKKESSGKYYNPVIYDACMAERGYNRLGKKVK